MLAAGLARKFHPRDFRTRVGGIVEDHLVTRRRSGEVAIDHPRFQEIARKRLGLIAMQSRLELVGNEPIEGYAFRVCTAPR